MKQPIRILQIGMSSNPGGVENFIMNIYRNIDKSKIQFDFLIDHNAPQIAYEDEIINMGGRIYRDYYRRKEILKKGRRSVKNFFEIHPEIKGVHMHANTLNPMFKVLQVAQKIKIPVRILHSHNSNYMREPKIKDKIYGIYERTNLKKYTTNLLACSEIAGKWMFKSNQFKVIKNGIDVNKFKFNEKIRKNLRNKLAIEDNFVIGHVGRMNYQKNPIFLLEIFYEIYKRNNNSKLIYIGDGELKDEIKEYIKEKKIADAVILMGKKEKVNDYYNVMDVFLLPSKFEGLPLTLVEAQANGLKCFVSDTISEESNITGSIDYISLNKKSEYWADLILKNGKERRNKDIEEDFKLSGYDIQQSVSELEKMYLKGDS